MDTRRSCCALFVVAVFFSLGCETESYDNGPTPVCVSAAGVWDVTMVAETGTGIACSNRTLVWTIEQNGCDVTLQPATWDPTTSATGGITDNHLYVEWTWFEGCYRYTETVDATVDGDMMTGKYYLARGQEVYPAYCPGLGMCSTSVNAVRRGGL
jgi:hypothetical protein